MKRFVGSSRRLLVWAVGLGLLGVACSTTGDVEQTLGRVDEQLADVAVDPFRPAETRAIFLPDPPEGMVTVKLDFPKYLNELPGQIEVHAPAGASDRLWATESLPPGKRVPAGDLIDDGIVFVNPGEMGLVTLVYHNPTDEDIRIRTVAPFVDPAVATPLAYGRCWCDAPGFDVPAGGSWYRTIGVGVASVTPAGAKAVVTWPVIVES